MGYVFEIRTVRGKLLGNNSIARAFMDYVNTSCKELELGTPRVHLALAKSSDPGYRKIEIVTTRLILADTNLLCRVKH